MFKSIINLFSEGKKETVTQVFEEQKTIDVWYKTLSLHLQHEDTFFFVVDYSKEEMVKISKKPLSIDTNAFNSQFVFELNAETVVSTNNQIRVKKLISALNKYYKQQKSVDVEQEDLKLVFNN